MLARNANAGWQKRGIEIHQLSTTKGSNDGRIYPHFQVYPPTRQEYLKLLPKKVFGDDDEDKHKVLWDIGTGTGVLTAVLLERYRQWTAIATDVSSLAVECARDNLQRLGLLDRVEVQQANIFPTEPKSRVHKAKADVIVCNPPWIPKRHGTGLDRAVFDNEESAMLRGLLAGAASHLRDDKSEVWLILSDFAEHLKLRSRNELLQWIDHGGLEIIHESHVEPKEKSKKSPKNIEYLFFPLVVKARMQEKVSLFRLRKKSIHSTLE